MFDTKQVRVPVTLKADTEGAIQAVFSTFNVVDSDGDVVLASAFTDGQAVPLVWAHNWEMPVGKGIIRVQPDAAVFDGRFFLDTSAGRDAYLTVKAMSEPPAIQEYSWGFRVVDSTYGEQDGKQVRFIQRAEVFEVSPVLVGANRQTRTLAIKTGERFDEQEGRLLADLDAYRERAAALAATRAKEGRAISTARRARLAKTAGVLREIADDLDGLLTETAPPEKAAHEAARILADFYAIQADLSTVGV